MNESRDVFNGWNKQYLIEYLVAFVFCVVACAICIPAAHAASSMATRGLLMLGPAAGILAIAFVVWRHFQRIDEFLRRSMLESFAAVGAIAFVGSLIYGQFELVGFHKISMWWVLSAAIVVCNARFLFLWAARR